MKKKSKQNSSGFSLIELILYVAITSLFLLSMTNFIWDIMYGRQKAHAQQIVEQSARFVVSRIHYELRHASDFTIVSSTSLQLTNEAGITSIFLDGTTLKITLPNRGTFNLTSNEAVVSVLHFSELNSAHSSSKQLAMQLEINQAQIDTSAVYDAAISVSASVELNSAFNQSRNLLIDLSNVVASSNKKSILGITLENTGSADLVISQLFVEWTGTSGGENIENIQIAGGSQWSGSQPSGSTIDITDYVLSSVAGSIQLDSLDFDAQIDGGTFVLKCILSDGSISEAKFLVQATGAPDPTPTLPTPSPTILPTPSPTIPPAPTSCTQYCQQSNYSGGVCRKNAADCNKAGETSLAGGNYLCTGGQNADTCCCAP